MDDPVLWTLTALVAALLIWVFLPRGHEPQ